MPPKKATKAASATAAITQSFTRVKTPKYYVGAHVSTKDGVRETITNIETLGGNAFALFLKNQQRWTQKPLDPSDVEQFHSRCKASGFDPRKHILPHSSYLINLGNPDDEKRAKAMACFQDDLERCEQLGIGLYNIHPGSSLGTDKQETIKRIATCINKAHKQTEFVTVVLENMAGQGKIIGSVLEDIRDMIALIEDKSRIGVCIDTCHTFAAGYDLRDEETFNAFWKKFDDMIGYKYLSAIHLNDSKAPLDSKRDLHQNIGLGFLGLEAFRLVMNKKELEGLPMILETPASGGGDKNAVNDSRGEEIKLLEWLTGRSKEDPEFVSKMNELHKKGAKERMEHQTKYDKKAAAAAKGNKTLNFKRKREGEDEGEEDRDGSKNRK